MPDRRSRVWAGGRRCSARRDAAQAACAFRELAPPKSERPPSELLSLSIARGSGSSGQDMVSSLSFHEGPEARPEVVSLGVGRQDVILAVRVLSTFP